MKQYNLKENFLVKKHKNVYKLNNNQQNTFYGVYLYFFDEIRGHIPLFVYPAGVSNENEKRILSIHSIWWYQDKFLTTSKFSTIDLELGGFVYSATLFFCYTHRTKRRSGMDSTKWKPERFVLIVKAPSEVSFIAQEILFELKTRIQSTIGEDLCFLVDSHLKIKVNSEIREFIEEKSGNIRQQLKTLCNSLIPKIPIDTLKTQLDKKNKSNISLNQDLKHLFTEETKKMHFSIPKGKKIKNQNKKKEVVLGLEPKRVKIVQVSCSEDNKIVRVVVRNYSSDYLINTLIKIYESQGFFGKDILISKVPQWEPKKDISLEFESTNEIGIIYFLKVEDEHGLIKLKKIFSR